MRSPRMADPTAPAYTSAFLGVPAGTQFRIESSPAVANGVVYVTVDDGHLYAYDAAGETNCSGTPGSCSPLWSAPTGTIGGQYSSPAVANGVVYFGTPNHQLLAFDATGTQSCGGDPKTCSPLFESADLGLAVASSPAVANGRVYVGDNFGRVHAFALP